MIIHALKLRQTEGENLHILNSGLQAVQSSDMHLLRSMSRTLHQMLSSEKTLAAPLPLTVNADLPGRGSLSALLVESPEDLRESVKSITLGNDAPEIIGADLMLLSFEELLEAGNDYERIALEMAAFTDAGNSHHGLIAALARLDGFVGKIGRGADADTTLGRMKTRMESLKTERAAAIAALEQAAKLAQPLNENRELVRQCLLRKQTAEKMRCACIANLVNRIQEQCAFIEAQIAEKSGKPCLDPGQAADIQRAENLYETCRMQIEKTQKELQVVLKELEGLKDTASPAADNVLTHMEVLELLQHKIQHSHGRSTEFNARLDEVNNQINALDTHIAETQNYLATLPDFSRIAPNPIDWLNQLARSFKTALTTRDGEEEARDAMRAELADLRVEIAGDAAIFEGSGNFAEELIIHQNKRKQWDTRSTQIEEQVRENRSLRDELAESIPGHLALSLGCGVFLILLLGAYFGSQKTPILYTCGFLLPSTVFFTVQLLATRNKVARLTRSIAEGQAELDIISEESKGDVSQVDRLMTRADCRSVRELEARYDRYRELRAQLTALEEKYTQQEENLLESEERIPKLFERVRSTLEQVDEVPRNEDDVEGAVGRAIAKYQVYRETKRRLADLRNQHQGLLSRKRFLEKELAAVREGLPEAEQQARAFMREQGFVEEADHRDISAALAAFYRFMDVNEKDSGRRSAITRTRQSLEARLTEEQEALEEHKQAFDTLLRNAGFETLEQARSAANNTMTLRDLEHEKERLEHERETLLQGRPLESWLKSAGDAPLSDSTDVEYYNRKIAEIEQESETSFTQYNRLHQERSRILGAHRTINEIEEDLAALEKQMGLLRGDVSAAAHAVALTEDSLHAWRTQYGEAISERASQLLEMLGLSALLQLDLDPNNVPSIQVITDDGQDSLPGALVNLSLRLAAHELLICPDSPRPLIVDAILPGDNLPVAPEKLLDILGECAQKRQVILMFDAESMVSAVVKKQIPLLRL